MNIANQILFAVVITSVTGTAAYGLWRLLMNSRFCTKPQYVYLALFLVCLLYLIPLDYGWMQMTIHGYLQKEGIWQINFSLTGFLWILAFFAAVCWLALMAKGITEFAGSLRGMKRIQMRDIPEEEEAVREEFARVKKKLGIRSNIRLYRNDRITSPMLAGIFRCRVVLPDIAYDRKHLSVIFHHELMHYKSHDPFVRLCGMCVTAVHHINPLTGNLMVLLDEWSEIYCDARAIAAISDEMDAGCYFEMIIESVKHSPVTDENYIFSMLYENQRRLERRIEYMGKYNGKAASRLASMCFAAAFVLIYIVVKVIINALHLFSKLPGLNFLNRFSGFLAGGAKGIVCVWLAGIVLTFFQCRGAFAELFSAMERTLFAGYFYENNILLQLILTIFT